MSRTAKRVAHFGRNHMGEYVTPATIKNRRAKVGKNRRTIEKKRRRASR
jgi:hypothetical protein